MKKKADQNYKLSTFNDFLLEKKSVIKIDSKIDQIVLPYEVEALSTPTLDPTIFCSTSLSSKETHVYHKA